MVKESLFVTFLISSLFYSVLLILFEDIDIQILSSINLFVILLSAFFIKNRLENDISVRHDAINTNFFFKYIDFWKYSNGGVYSISTVLMSILIGVLSLYLLVGNLNFSLLQDESGLDFRKIVFTTNTISIVLVQFGGWVIQTFLIYFLAILFDGEAKFNSYLKVVGLAYIAYFIGALISLIYNQKNISQTLSLGEFEYLMNDNLFLKLIGKISEYLALIYIAYGLMTIEKFKFFNALFISFIPSILLIVFKIIFEFMFKL